jgi:PAS domain S-box-containing protein
MPVIDKSSSTDASARELADDLARGKAANMPEDAVDLSPSALRQLNHELRVHQIELEMQNDELRRMQDERDKAQARYFDFYDLAPVGYITVNEQGRVLHANVTAAALLGVTKSQLAGQAFSRYIARSDQDRYYLLRRKLSEIGSATSCELQMYRHDGDSFFSRIDALAARGDDGTPVLRLVLIDTTEKNAAAAAAASAAAANDKFMHAILNSVNAEVVVLDRHGVITAVNQRWQNFALENSVTLCTPAVHSGVGTDYLATCQERSGNPMHATATAAHDGIYAVLTGALPSFSLEYPCSTPEQQRWFSMCALPLGNDLKDGLTITHTDITAIRQAEVSQRIAAVAFEAQEAIVVMDCERQILRVNHAFTEITGYTEKELLRRSIGILYSKRHSASFYESIWQRTDAEGRERGGRWVKHKNGDDLFAQGTTTAVKDKQEQTTHYVITFSDQTLTHQQDQQRVQQEAAHRDALVREVHHRIKNNLQGIGGLLQLFAIQKPEISEQMRLVAGHLKGISVIHGLQGRNEKSSVRLCELTREIAQTTSSIWQTEVRIDIPPQWPCCIVAEREAVSLALVLNELMVNAVKHGGKAQGYVNVAIRQGQGIEGVELRILNTGNLHNSKDCPSGHKHGLQLIESLRPREGLTLTLTQQGDQVLALLQVSAPVISPWH